MNYLLLTMLRGILRKDVWEVNSGALLGDTLTNADVKTLVQYVAEKHESKRGDLSTHDLVLAIESKYRRPDGRKVELLDLVRQLDTVDDLPFEEIQPVIADFLGRELAAQAMVYIGSREESDKFDLHYPYELLEQAIALSTGASLDVECISDVAPPSAEGERMGVSTVGLGPRMDEHLGGGAANGEMLIWLAPPAVGKTSLLVNQGVEMAKGGEYVLHVTLEINRAKCWQRVDQKLTGMSREQRISCPGAVMVARKSIAGRYYVKDWSARNVTVDDVRSLVRRMRSRGLVVTAVVVDYLELMAPTAVNRHGERFNHSQTARELRRLGNELNVKVCTAWQVNRAGADKHVVGAVDVSECWDIVKHADIILGLNQSSEELLNHVLRINVIKQRESTARPIEYYYSNLDRMVIREQGEGDYDEEPDEVGSRCGPRLGKHGSSLAAGL